MDEADSAKYVWKMCVLQHTFYKMHASATESNELNITLEHPQPGSGTNNSSSNSANNTHFVNHANAASITASTTVPIGGDLSQQSHFNTVTAMQQVPPGGGGPEMTFSQYHNHPEYLQQHHHHQFGGGNYNSVQQQQQTPKQFPMSAVTQQSNIQHSEIESFHAQQTQRVDLVTTAASRQQQNHQQQQHVINNEVGGGGYVLRPAISSLSIGGGIGGGFQVQDDLVINNRYHKRPQTIGGGGGQPTLSSARSVNDLDQLTSYGGGGQLQPFGGPPLPLISQPLPTVGTAGLSYYRPAPDYETAIRNKYGNGILTQLGTSRQQQQQQQFQQQQAAVIAPSFQQQVSQQNIYTSHPTLITDALPTQTAVIPNNSGGGGHLGGYAMGGQAGLLDSSWMLSKAD